MPERGPSPPFSFTHTLTLSAQSSDDRARAEEALAAFRAGVPSIGPCKVKERERKKARPLPSLSPVRAHSLPSTLHQSLLDATASPYARLLALSSLLKTVTEAPLE